ncbi:MAG: VWA domain-containing protein [Proteobacteria bacterium]|nr:VWA domain-containing protein [Pseudomonadota bacterium]MBU1737843.1 VWA domain-containing protein [Pseudomonadota bacterium]
MNAAILKERFLDLLPPPLPSDWEVEENLEPLLELPESRQERILQQIQAIWPVSNSLCYSYLNCADRVMGCLADEQVGVWVAELLDTYEKNGLKEAQSFMVDVEKNFLCRLRGETGVSLETVLPRLLPYAAGIARRRIALEEGSALYTDTARIFLPGKLSAFSREADNFLLYKLMVTTQLCLIRARTFEMVITPESPWLKTLQQKYNAPYSLKPITADDFWKIFPEPPLAEDLFTLAEGWRVLTLISEDYPGLWRDTAELRAELAKSRFPEVALSGKSLLVEILAHSLLIGRTDRTNNTSDTDLFRLILSRFLNPSESAEDSAKKTAAIYALLDDLREPYEPVAPLPFLGRLRPAAARQVRLQERDETRQKFIEALAAILPDSKPMPEEEPEPTSESGESPARFNSDNAVALLISPADQEERDYSGPAENPEDISSQLLIIGGPDLEIPEALQELAAEISRDLGKIPDDYISAAQGLAGRGEAPPTTAATPGGESLPGAITYDEWDYRRAGFRKSWCHLNEKRVHPVKGTFVQKTLDKYRGLLIRLRRQFEMLRSAERLVRRQREGDEIDLDAVVESISDTRAGRPESEKLFIRLKRDDRDIAGMFLIDMSSSTEGWVGEALKEALILMGESLEVLGDRYAIAGFSGMRRTRSDFYHIKDFSESYSEEIKGRIAAIAPQEYTRMGPPVRHAIRMLQGVDARVRLLIVLSDGKPEDYDDYKGEYAIEDTRHALIEAKAAGIHPFCITIDQQAHDYNAHMYGEVNYIFLDKVSDLPIRMPVIYRNLTS